MAWRCFYIKNTPLIVSDLKCVVRHGHHMRGKPPDVARSIEQRFEELRRKDPILDFKVDIGLPPKQLSRKQQLQERLSILKSQKKDEQLEKLSRDKKLRIDLDLLNKEWKDTGAHHYIKNVADHYKVYEHLFGDAYFYSVVPLNVIYQNEDADIPVYYGNIIKPSEATKKPQVMYESKDDTLWTLILTNPDGHFTEQDKEYVHWFVGNIPGNKVEKGETIVEYLQPFPPKGTGYHRHIFVLYKQEKKLDFSKFKKSGPCFELSDRTFKTLDFYRDRQDDLTPAGLAFFQANWDSTLTDFYHNQLSMKEPIFEYDFQQFYHPKPKWFPKRKAFNLYMDRYRDPKQINKEFLLRKLKNVHPFKEPPSPYPFPNAIYIDQSIPSWLKLEIRKSRLKWGRINEIQ